MSLCPDLATKQELASLERQLNKELERKIPTKEKDSIVNDGGLKGKSLVVGSIALIGGTANNALNKANQTWNGLTQALGNADNAYRVAKSAQSTANNNTSSPTTIAFAVGGLDILRQINENSSKSSCQAPTLVPPIGTSVTNLQALNTAQNIGIQNTVNTINKTVSHGTHGLEAIKKAADVAWKATHADKALQMLNTVVVISNAMALGTNIVDTVGDTASLVLSSLGIKDSTGQAINVNQVIGNTVKNWIVGIVGQANYVAYEQKIKSRLRTYQAAANLYSSVRSMLASAEDIAEETGISVAKIGNALRDSNTVETDSYGYMPEGKRRINSIFNALEHADDQADSLNRIARDVADITDEAVEFIQDRIEFKNLLQNEKKLEIRNEERETNRIESLPNIEEKDKLETVDKSS